MLHETVGTRAPAEREATRLLPVASLALGVFVRLPLLTRPGYPGDSEAFLIWARWMVEHGFTAVYSLDFPPVNYSPVVLWVLAVIGWWLIRSSRLPCPRHI